MAAEALSAPVIIGTAEILLPAASLEELSHFLIPMAKKAKVPVVVHFDHGITENAVYTALRLGFTSVMYDCSEYTYEENLTRVAAMAKVVHGMGATIEGELGHVGANEGAAEGGAEDHSIYTDPAVAREFAGETGIDALAVAIGNAHGLYKSKPKLDVGILEEIAASVACPLVLHGGSGLTDDDFRHCIEKGISKVNIFTDINNAAAEAAVAHYGKGIGFSDLSPFITSAVMEAAMMKMRLFGSAGKA